VRGGIVQDGRCYGDDGCAVFGLPGGDVRCRGERKLCCVWDRDLGSRWQFSDGVHGVEGLLGWDPRVECAECDGQQGMHRM
jgi:hypothetical protein